MTIKDINEGWLNYIKRSIDRRHFDQDLKIVVEKRADICTACPHLRVISRSKNRLFWGMCKKCACVFPAIVYAKSKKCPEGKWDSIHSDES
jgi:hypothetical protein